MSNLSMGLCRKLVKSVVWNTFAPVDKVVRSWNNWGQFINFFVFHYLYLAAQSSPKYNWN